MNQVLFPRYGLRYGVKARSKKKTLVAIITIYAAAAALAFVAFSTARSASANPAGFHSVH